MNGSDVNLFLTLSKFSIPSIFYSYLFDTSPEKVILNDEVYDIYPMGIQDGIAFFNFLSKQIFENYQPTLLDGIKPNPDDAFADKKVISELFSFLDEVYSLTEETSLSSLMWKSGIKQIKYLLYIIKKQNFTFIEPLNEYENVNIISSLLDSMILELKEQVAREKAQLHIIKDAKDYNISSSVIEVQNLKGSVNKFCLDYVLNSEDLYSIVANSFVPKFFSIAEKLPSDRLNNGPLFWCSLLNSKCIQSCAKFDINCIHKKIKRLSYIPFKSLYIIPQLISLIRTQSKKEDLESNIKSLLYSLSIAFGKREGIDKLATINHSVSIFQLAEKNKHHLLESLFNNADIKEIENTVRDAIGLTKIDMGEYPSLISTLGRIYEFLSSNKNIFMNFDETRLSTLSDCIENHIRVFLVDHTYSNKSIDITSEDDFTNYIIQLKTQIIHLDNMLRKFPNDNPNLHTTVSALIDSMNKTKEQLKKMGGGSKNIQIDKRESLLKSESILFKRIAVDSALFAFYKENNRTKLINNIVFQKWAIALFFFNEKIIKLDEDHPIQTMDFNEI